MLLHNLYNRLSEETNSMYQFSSKVKVSIYISNDSTDKYSDIETEEIIIPYNIDVEYRSWGIKSIYPLVTATVKVPYIVKHYETETGDEKEELREISLDLSTAELEWVEGGTFSLYELILSLTEDGGVANARIVCSYINPEKGG